ncbi:MAG: divalent-cation tolerance protein CutA [Pseudomonadota bacterium]
MDYAIVFTACPTDQEARVLASALIAQKLAACVQLSKIESFYTWKGDVCIDPEIRLTIKTKAELYPCLEAFIKEHHTYEVPQIIMVPIKDGSKTYLDWIEENTK